MEMIATRTCRHCQQAWPLDTAHFASHEGGLRHVCRSCQRAQAKGELAVAPRSRMGEAGPERQCTKCSLWKPEDQVYFGVQPKGRGGLEAACKACKRARRRDRYSALPAVQSRAAERAEKARVTRAGARTCRTCRVRFPAWKGHFYKPKSASCIPCEQAGAAEIWAQKYGDRKVLDPTEPLKKCSRCGVVWPRSAAYFGGKPEAYDGLNPHCKSCQSAYRRQHYLEHQDENRAASREQWLNMTPGEKVRRRLLRRGGGGGQSGNRFDTAARNHNARARRLGIPGRVKAAELRDLLEAQEHRCAHCERELTAARRPQADHLIPLGRPELAPTGDVGNFAWTCGRCNQFRNNRTLDEWTPRWYENPELLLAEDEFERLLAESE